MAVRLGTGPDQLPAKSGIGPSDLGIKAHLLAPRLDVRRPRMPPGMRMHPHTFLDAELEMASPGQ